jgi:hypothetical protein
LFYHLIGVESSLVDEKDKVREKGEIEDIRRISTECIELIR